MNQLPDGPVRKYSSRLIAGILILFLAAAGLVFYFISRDKSAPTAPSEEEQKSVPVVRVAPKTFLPVDGWYSGKPIQYYDFDQSKDNIGNVYVLVTGFDKDNNPQYVANQKDIYDSKRGDTDYSDFRRVQYVTVPANYTADSLKSLSEIKSNNWPIKDGGRIENRPQVLADDKIDPDRPKIEGWVNGEKVYAWIFETNIQLDPGDSNKVLANTMYIPVIGYNEVNDPKTVQNQKNILSSAPSASDYSPLCEWSYVEVPADYAVDTLKSTDDVLRSGYKIKKSGILVNVPVYSIDGKVTLPSPGQVSGQQPVAPGSQGVAQPIPETISSQLPSKTVTTGQAPLTYGPKYVAVPIAAKQPTMQTIPLPPPANIMPVCIIDLRFEPDQITVSSGTTVIWRNSDVVPHTVTSDDGRIDSGIILPGGEFQLVFMVPDIRYYHSDTYPQATGVVIVQ